MLVVNIPDLRECDDEMKKYSHKVFKNLIEFKDKQICPKCLDKIKDK